VVRILMEAKEYIAKNAPIGDANLEAGA